MPGDGGRAGAGLMIYLGICHYLHMYCIYIYIYDVYIFYIHFLHTLYIHYNHYMYVCIHYTHTHIYIYILYIYMHIIYMSTVLYLGKLLAYIIHSYRITISYSLLAGLLIITYNRLLSHLVAQMRIQGWESLSPGIDSAMTGFPKWKDTRRKPWVLKVVESEGIRKESKFFWSFWKSRFLIRTL